MKQFKRVISLCIVCMTLIGITACGSSNPCSYCRNTPTKAYKNDYTGEKDYFCSECSSNCAFCSKKATKHYTSALGMIVFTCNDCYEEVKKLNSNY